VCVILVFSLIATCPCALVSQRQWSSCFEALRRLCSIKRSVSQPVLLSLLWPCRGWITAVRLWRAFFDEWFSPSWMLRRALHVTRRSTTTSHICFETCTGCEFRLATLVFQCRQNLASPCLANDLRWTDESESLQLLRSGSTQRLIVTRTRLRTRVTTVHMWNSLPSTVTAATSLVSFERTWKFTCFIAFTFNYVPCRRSYSLCHVNLYYYYYYY